MKWVRPLDLVEAGYRLDGTDEEWMRGLVDTASRVFGSSALGVGGFVIATQVDAQGRRAIERTGNAYGTGRALLGPMEPVLDRYRDMPAEVQERIFFATPAGTASQALGLGAALSEHPLWLENAGWDPRIARDALGLLCHDATRNLVVLGVALPAITTLSERERRLGERVAIHIGTALRLRRAGRSTPDTAAAVLSTSGKLQHQQAGADLPAIARGFALRRHARGGRIGPDSALEVWQGLHDGRWSLVDYIDIDGKAFVLAVRNEPAREVASTLTDRQRAAVALAALGYGNKQIAYALGLTVTAVAMLLARARAATGLRTRAELVRGFKRSLAERL
ncbi:MAG TPA: sigma factor-like helix-turn-helix DNA-binding protein [Polyangia bacterium]|nr:sigma factor-like helix-turn-helix DNA-binding protein [Polyangia bacterium]